MAGLESLTGLIYHEKQEPGSMLCAQHALNSLMQAPYFTAPDLSQIAERLDQLEQSYDHGNKGESTNMDDTGFFSVQVLEEALKVWGLALVRWRSPEMIPFHHKPHTQLAFILNLDQHWFSLRRFGRAATDPNLDPGEGHWYNLNSFLSRPEWVSRTYLGMVLQQAEQEGYSVFAIRQIDPNKPLALARTPPDQLAVELPPPSGPNQGKTLSTSFPGRGNTLGGSSSTSSASAAIAAPTPAGLSIPGLEDEDLELQAALQASLMASGGSGSAEWQPFPASSAPAPRPSRPPPPDTAAPNDPAAEGLAASIARGKAELQRLQREQEMALRETYEEEVAQTFSGTAGATSTRRATARVDEEDEMLRLAMAASRQAAGIAEPDPDNDDDDEDYVMDDEDEQEMVARHQEMRRSEQQQQQQQPVRTTTTEAPTRLAKPPPVTRSTISSGILAPGELERAIGSSSGLGLQNRPRPEFGVPTGAGAAHLDGSRTYDDEDADLQAALRASLQDMPQGGVTIPPIHPAVKAVKSGGSETPYIPSNVATAASSAPGSGRASTVGAKGGSDNEDEGMVEDNDVAAPEPEPEPPAQPTAEEMRRARLARFGG